ncbi:unknown [Clostridium sp. CAG:921]|nr:unknown [Clostridium sp. CAG:921]
MKNKKNIGNETAAIKLYEDLIDNIVSQYSNDSSEYLSIYIDDALDPLNKELLSEESKKEILSYSKKYNYNIYNMEKEDLILLNDNNYENLNGLCT